MSSSLRDLEDEEDDLLPEFPLLLLLLPALLPRPLPEFPERPELLLLPELPPEEPWLLPDFDLGIF
jgi:hypothetical protein